MGLLTVYSLNFMEINTTNNEGKMDEKVCIQISYKHYMYSLTRWTKCRGLMGKILIADWGSHGKFLNCSEYGSDTMYG